MTTPPIPPHALLLRGDLRRPRQSFLLGPLISAFPFRGAASRAGGRDCAPALSPASGCQVAGPRPSPMVGARGCTGLPFVRRRGEGTTGRGCQRCTPSSSSRALGSVSVDSDLVAHRLPGCLATARQAPLPGPARLPPRPPALGRCHSHAGSPRPEPPRDPGRGRPGPPPPDTQPRSTARGAGQAILRPVSSNPIVKSSTSSVI